MSWCWEFSPVLCCEIWMLGAEQQGPVLTLRRHSCEGLAEDSWRTYNMGMGAMHLNFLHQKPLLILFSVNFLK